MLSSKLFAIILLVGAFYWADAIKLPQSFVNKFMKGKIEIKSDDFLGLLTPKQTTRVEKVYPDLVDDKPWLSYADINDIFTRALRGEKLKIEIASDEKDDDFAEEDDDDVQILAGEKPTSEPTAESSPPKTSEAPKNETAKEESKPDKESDSKSEADQVCSEVEVLTKKDEAPVDKFKKILKDFGCQVSKGLDESSCILRLIRHFEDKKGVEFYRFNQTLIDSTPDVVVAKRDKVYTAIFDVEKFVRAVLKEKWWRVKEEYEPIFIDFPLTQEATGWPSLTCAELKKNEDKTKVESYKTVRKQSGVAIHAVKFKVDDRCNHYYFAYQEDQDVSNVLAVQKNIPCEVELGVFDKRITRLI